SRSRKRRERRLRRRWDRPPKLRPRLRRKQPRRNRRRNPRIKSSAPTAALKLTLDRQELQRVDLEATHRVDARLGIVGGRGTVLLGTPYQRGLAHEPLRAESQDIAVGRLCDGFESLRDFFRQLGTLEQDAQLGIE